MPPKGRGRDRSQAVEEESDNAVNEKCYEIKAIVGLAFDDPQEKKSRKRRRNVPAADDIWLEVVGTFADPDDDDDEGGPDRRWLQMEDLGHVSKSEVKKAIAAYEEEAKKAAKKALTRHKTVE